MSDDAPPPPMPPELATKLWRAVCRVMDEDTRDRLVIAGVDLDEAGPYAVAELREMDRSGRRRWLLRLWPCHSMPTPPPDMRWMSLRKFFGRVLSDDTVIEAKGQRYGDIYDWLSEPGCRTGRWGRLYRVLLQHGSTSLDHRLHQSG